MAVLERRAGLFLHNQDAYINVAGGIRLEEPAIDLGIVIAVASSFKNKAVNPGLVIAGEVGLTGEIRAVGSLEKRVAEALKAGYRSCLVPAAGLKALGKINGMEITGAENLNDALEVALGG